MKFKLLVNSIQQTHTALQQSAVKAVNSHLTIRNWLIGFYIVEYEQKGEDRAKYGKKLLEMLADKISIKGLSAPELSRCRQFYFCYTQILGSVSQEFNLPKSISQSLSAQNKSSKTKAPILGTLSQESEDESAWYQKLFSSIPFSHFTELIKINDPVKRRYYEMLTIKQTLSFRELKRQVNTLSFERLGLSANKTKALAQIEKAIKPAKAHDAVKDFYFFEFLELPHKELIEESELETALLNHLEKFILELGNGFCFEARQKRILIGDEYFFIDMVFYHRILQCHVLVELKVDDFNHGHAAQLNTYLKYFNKEVKTKNDNPPVGILMVTNKNKALVEYAMDGMDEKMFVSKYAVQLPDKKQLENFIKSELKKL
jgi:predicted nuclease of restriction endonuclease-like (RecB) superfamily